MLARSLALELNDEPDPEEDRKQYERLALDRDPDEAIDPFVERRSLRRPEKLREDRDSKFGEQIHEEHAEERQRPQDVEVHEPLGRRRGRERGVSRHSLY